MMSTTRLKVAGFVFAGCLVAATAAHALTLGEQRQYDKWVEFFKSSDAHGDLMQKKCGVSVSVTFDPALTTPFMAAGKSGAGFCDEALSTMAKMCDDDKPSKTAIASKLKSLSCSYNAANDDVVLNLVNGDLQFAFSANSVNLHEKIKKYLDNNL